NECLIARTRQDHAAHLSIVPRILKSRSQVLPCSLIESVEHLGTIESHINDAALLFVQDIVKRWRIHKMVSCAEAQVALHKGAKPCDGLADDQILHLECALIGVKRFAIG